MPLRSLSAVRAAPYSPCCANALAEPRQTIGPEPRGAWPSERLPQTGDSLRGCPLRRHYSTAQNLRLGPPLTPLAANPDLRIFAPPPPTTAVPEPGKHIAEEEPPSSPQ